MRLRGVSFAVGEVYRVQGLRDEMLAGNHPYVCRQKSQPHVGHRVGRWCVYRHKTKKVCVYVVQVLQGRIFIENRPCVNLVGGYLFIG